MAIDKLKTVFTTGAWLTNVKTFYKKINEIIDYLNGTGTTGSGSYKKYVAIVNQVDTGIPTDIVLENTLGGTVVWSYLGVGEYLATLTGAFTENKTVIFTSFSTLAFVTPSWIYTQRVSDDSIYFVTIDNATNNANNILKSVCVEIRVYN